jgi:hypothetical protein
MTTYWRAKDIEAIVEQLVPEHQARKISGLNAHLVGLVRRDDLGDDPADFFVVEVPHEPWQVLTEAQRLALVDHELAHFYVSIPEGPDEARKLVMLGHDLEEFTAVVERHGLWRPDLREFARVVARRGDQPTLDDLPDADVATGEIK